MASTSSDFDIQVTADSSQAQGDLEQLAKKTEAYGETAGKAGGDVEGGARSIKEAFAELRNQALELFAGEKLIEYSKEIIELADKYDELLARVKNATNGQEEYQAAVDGINAVAAKQEQSLDTVGSLYLKVAEGTRALGLSQQQNIAITDTLIAAVRLSGEGFEAAQEQVAALARGLADGTITGKAFTGAIEKLPQLADAIAKQLGVSREELKRLVTQGAIDSQTLANAILGAQEELDAQAEKLPKTIEEGMTAFGRGLTLYAKGINDTVGLSHLAGEAIGGLAHNFDLLAQYAATGATIGVLKLVSVLVEKTSAMVGASKAAKEEAAAIIEAGNAAADAAIAEKEQLEAKTIGLRVREQAASAAHAEALAQLEAAEGYQKAALAEAESAKASAEVAIALGDQKLATDTLSAASEKLALADKAVSDAQTQAALSTKALADAQGRLIDTEQAAAAAAEKAALAQKAAADAAETARKSNDLTVKSFLSLNTAISAFIALDIGSTIGKVLYENFETARIAGSYLAQEFVELKLALQSLTGQISDDEFLRRTADAKASFDEIRASASEYGKEAVEASKSASDAAQAQADAINNKVSLAVQLLANKFDAATKSGKTTVEALAELGKGLDPASVKSVDTYIQALGLLETKGKITARQLDTSIGDELKNLSADQVAKFQQSLIAAFDTGTSKSAAFAQALQAVRDQQLSRLGVDAQQAATGISKAVTDSITVIKSLGANTETTASQMQAALEGALNGAKTREEAKAIADAVATIKFGAFDGAAAVKQLQAEIDKLPTEAEKLSPLEAAFKQLGVASKSALDEAAQAARDAFDVIKGAGLQATGAGTQAFEKLAEAEIKAAAAAGDTELAIVSGQLRAQAVTEGQREAVQKLTLQYAEQNGLIKAISDDLAAADKAEQDSLAGLSRGASAAGNAFTTLRQSISQATNFDQVDELRSHLVKMFSDGSIAAQEFEAALAAVNAQEVELLRQTRSIDVQTSQLIKGYDQLGDVAKAAIDQILKTPALGADAIRGVDQRAQRVADTALEQEQSITQIQAAIHKGQISPERLLQIQKTEGANFNFASQASIDSLNQTIQQFAQGLQGALQLAGNPQTTKVVQFDVGGQSVRVLQADSQALESILEQLLNAKRISA